MEITLPCLIKLRGRIGVEMHNPFCRRRQRLDILVIQNKQFQQTIIRLGHFACHRNAGACFRGIDYIQLGRREIVCLPINDNVVLKFPSSAVFCG